MKRDQEPRRAPRSDATGCADLIGQSLRAPGEIANPAHPEAVEEDAMEGRVGEFKLLADKYLLAQLDLAGRLAQTTSRSKTVDRALDVRFSILRGELDGLTLVEKSAPPLGELPAIEALSPTADGSVTRVTLQLDRELVDAVARLEGERRAATYRGGAVASRESTPKPQAVVRSSIVAYTRMLMAEFTGTRYAWRAPDGEIRSFPLL